MVASPAFKANPPQSPFEKGEVFSPHLKKGEGFIPPLYYLLYNGILGDRRPQGVNVLTSAVLAYLDEEFPHAGARVIYVGISEFIYSINDIKEILIDSVRFLARVTFHVEPGKLSRPSSGGTSVFVPSCNVRIASPEQLGTNC